jgi:type IV pilus assembly protein PilO
MKLTPINLANINWDLNAAWSWPTPIRVAVIIACSLFTALICFNYDTQSQLIELQSLKQNEIQLKTVFEAKQKQTGDLHSQQAKSNEMESQWLNMAEKMPKEESASTLLHTISQIGIHYNLEFKSLQLMPKVPQNSFDELPIHIEVIGKYKDLYSFIGELEQLTTLVTLHDFTVSPLNNTPTSKSSNRLLMSLLIKAYRPSENPKKNVAQ